MTGRKLDPRLREALRWARLSALVLGTGLLAWGLAPLAIQRLHAYHVPGVSEWTNVGFTLFIGGLFIGLARLIGSNVAWALWAATVLSVALLLSAFAMVWSTSSALAIAPVVLASATALTNWLALSVRRRVPDARSTPRPRQSALHRN